MRTCKALSIWSTAAVLGCSLLVTALPRLEYIHVVERTILIDSSDGSDDYTFPWFPYGLPYHQGEAAYDIDTDASSDVEVNAGSQVSEDTQLEAVRVPATVYPHDTSPTATFTDASNESPSGASPPSAAAGSAMLQHQPRNALPNPEEDVDTIPSSLKAQEASAPPIETSTLPIAMPCAGLSSCPKGYKTYLLMGECSCRRPPKVED